MADREIIEVADAAGWTAWLEQNHGRETGVWLKIAKKGAPTTTPTQPEAVETALCFGWIDGQGRGIDDERHMQRFTPRKSRRWSAVNVALIAELEAAGRMTDAGRRAFEARDRDQVPYSTSKRPDRLPPEWDARLREHPDAAAYWDAAPPSYRKSCVYWVTEAKRPETREKRFAEFVAACARGERVARFVSPTRKAS
jgi:uncharacterized protein YdeI (YjbR/CyaY-like superfamily)